MNQAKTNTKIRGFVGISFKLHDELLPLRTELEKLAELKSTKLRIAPAENLHITLKFLGNMEQEQLPSLALVLRNIGQEFSPLRLKCHNIGFFKNSIWVGIEDNPELGSLATSIDEACGLLGYPTEARNYVPHVTVARFGKEAKIKLSELQQKFGQHEWGEFTADKMHLYQSQTLASGAIYSVIDSFELNAEN